jgi:diaminohydroxyphosphoribosylaminopyrimidine deaminase/5-amino-6-(5-phosphoribosylamino)uracil reductase
VTRALDAEWMKRALANAEKGWGQTAPNPMVGAVVVSSNVAVGDGWHERYGGPHAEVMALKSAGPRASGATLYVTLEPCAHYGKTPPCVDAILAADIRRVVMATPDANPQATGGIGKLRAAGIEVEIGIEQPAALELNAPFFNSFTSDRPWIVLKLAVSADGGVADPTGQRRWITGEAARTEVHRMRANSDAVAVGVETVIADDPDLRVRSGPAPRRQPTRVVFDRTLRIPRSARLVGTARETATIVVAAKDDPVRRGPLESAGVRVLLAEGLADALRKLRDQGITSMLLEGGPRLAGAFLTERLVDRIALFTAPLALGPDAPRAFAHAPLDFLATLNGFPVVRRGSFHEDSLIVRALRPIPAPRTLT